MRRRNFLKESPSAFRDTRTGDAGGEERAELAAIRLTVNGRAIVCCHRLL